MGTSLPPRRITAGELIPTVAQTGSEGDNSAFRINNLLLRGPEEGRRYWESFSGLGNVGQNIPMSVMTGTLSLTANSNEVVGTGTLFLTECPYIGMRISCIPADNSANHFIVVKRVIDDTHMTVWTPPYGNPPWPTVSNLVGWRMPRGYAVNDQLGVSTWGNVIKLDKGSFVGAGLGTFFLNGSQLSNSLTLSRRPSIALYDPVTSTYTVFELGMDTPSPPTLAAVGGGSKMQGGNYSFVITPARKETGGYNNPSDRADVTISTNDLIQCTFPAMDTANGQNAWIVWVTTFTDTLGADLNYLNGPWHRFRLYDDTEVSPAGGSVNIEYYDTEVENNILVSFNNDPPTDAMGVESMNTNIIWTSVQGQGFATNPEATSPGPFLSPAKPNNIEAAPLELAVSSSPPETIIGTIPGAQGRIYAETVNHLQIVQATPSNLIPFIIRPLWRSGFATWEQVVFVDGVLYGFPVSGPVRSAGEGDESYIQHDWGAKVYAITKNWNPGQVLAGYDPRNDAVILFHIADSLNSEGFWTTKWLAYGIALQKWLGGGVFTSDVKDSIVCGLATVNDDLLLLTSGRVA